MKKFILTGCLFLGLIGSSFAQNQTYRIADKDGNNYENNSVHYFSEHGTFSDAVEAAKLYLVAHNDSPSTIYVAGELVEITNTDGTLAQFCIGGMWGNCFFPLTVGGYYPSNNGGILPGESTWGTSDYLINLDPIVGASYKVRFTEKNNETGDDIPDTNFFITYVYTGVMGVTDMDTKAVAEVYPTVAKGFTNVNLNEHAKVQIINLEGKSVKSTSLQAGTHKLDLAGLAAGVYWVAFKGDSGKTTSIKVVVK